MTTVEASTGVKATFLPSSPGEREALAEAVGSLVPGSEVDLDAMLVELAPYEASLLAWLDGPEQNGQRFLEDPIAALESADLGIGGETLKQVRAASEALARAAGTTARSTPAEAQAREVAIGGAPLVRTKGWDLIAAATQETLDTTLAAAFEQGLIPHTITQPVKFGPLGSGTVTVNIAAPTVDLNPSAAQGQSGFVGITIPIVSGTIKLAEEITIPAGSLEVVTNIAYVHLDAKREGTIERLSLDLTSKLAIYNVIINEPEWEEALTDLIEVALREYLQSLPPASIYLGDVNIPQAAAPFAPVGEADFSIQHATNPAENVLLLLMTTSGGKTPTEPGATEFNAVPSLVPTGKKSALYLSNRLLIEGLIVPELSESLKVERSSFSCSGNPTTPYSARFSGAKGLGGEYEPELTGLTLSVNGSGQVQGNYAVHAHPLFNAGETYYVLVEGSIFVTPTLNTASQQITFATSANPGTGEIKCSVWGWLIVAAAIIASFGTLGAFIAIVLAIVVPIVITQLKFPVSLPPSLLASIQNSLGSFTWPAQKEYPLSALELSGDLVLLGEPVI